MYKSILRTTWIESGSHGIRRKFFISGSDEVLFTNQGIIVNLVTCIHISLTLLFSFCFYLFFLSSTLSFFYSRSSHTHSYTRIDFHSSSYSFCLTRYLCTCMYVCVCCMYVCVYIYIYLYIFIYLSFFSLFPRSTTLWFH